MDIEPERQNLQMLPTSHQEKVRQEIIRDYYEREYIEVLAEMLCRKVDSVKRTILTYNKRHNTARKKASGRSTTHTRNF